MDPTVQKAVKYESLQGGNNVVKLKWMHVQGAFAALALGSALGFIVFILELVQFYLNCNVKKA